MSIEVYNDLEQRLYLSHSDTLALVNWAKILGVSLSSIKPAADRGSAVLIEGAPLCIEVSQIPAVIRGLQNAPKTDGINPHTWANGVDTSGDFTLELGDALNTVIVYTAPRE